MKDFTNWTIHHAILSLQPVLKNENKRGQVKTEDVMGCVKPIIYPLCRIRKKGTGGGISAVLLKELQNFWAWELKS